MAEAGWAARGPDGFDGKSPTGIAPVLQVHPTRHCNLACAHCYSSSGPQVREELDFELLMGGVADAFALGYRQLAVSGGEPLLYPRLADLLQGARWLGMLTTVTTNGMLATPRRWAAIAPWVDVLAISIDGRPSEHDEIRQRQGAFTRTVENLAAIRASGVPFGFIFTLTQHNVDSLDYVVRLAAEQGAGAVQVHPLSLDGRAATAMAGARPDAIELMTAIAEAARLGDDLGVAVRVDVLTGAQLAAYPDHLVPSRPVRRLSDVAPVLILQADGVVVPLTHQLHERLALGSLKAAALASLAQDWLAAGGGDEVAEACRLTWDELSAERPLAVNWYEAVAARVRRRVLA